MSNEIAKYIDHTLLAPNATSKDVSKLCKDAAEHGFYAVCVNPHFVKLCKRNSATLKCMWLRSSDFRWAAIRPK